MSIKTIFEFLGVHVPEDSDTLQFIKALRESRHSLHSILSQLSASAADGFEHETESAFEVFARVEQIILKGGKVPTLLDLLMAEDVDDYFDVVREIMNDFSVVPATASSMRKYQ